MEFQYYVPIFGQLVPIFIAPTPENVAGYTDGTKIVLSPLLKGVHKKSTLYHEMGHCLFARCGLRQSLSLEMEEIIVDQFATMFAEAFNATLKPKFKAWSQEDQVNDQKG